MFELRGETMTQW